MKRVLIPTLGLSILFMMVACQGKKEGKHEAVVYPATFPLKTDTVVTTDYVAKIQSVKNIEVRAQEKGFLEKIYVDEGQYVQAGQVLFSIMPQLYEADVLKAQAEVDQAEIDYKNASTLAQNDVVSHNEKAMAKAKLDAAKAELKAAQTHLSFTTIKAPFAGVINRIPLKIGSLVNEGDLLTSLSDNKSVYTYFNLSETQYLNYQKQTDKTYKKVGLILSNGDTFPQKGTIQNIEGEFDSETGNIAFRALFPNPDMLLRNGQSGRVLLDVPLKGALIIPQKSTFEFQGQKYVFAVDDKGKVKSRPIEVAYVLPDIYILRSGLSENDHFLLEGLQKVKDDDQVKTTLVSPEKALQSLKLDAD